MPNPMREKAKGRMVLAVPLIIFMDNVSGNVSKQWNKHHVIYMSNANLPREMLEKEFCLMAAMKESVCKAGEDGVPAWDCKSDEEVLLCPYSLFLGGDNPMQAEECSHGGLACNYFCRTCHVGGTRDHKHTLEGYSSLFKVQRARRLCTTHIAPRTPGDTRDEIERQIEKAFLPGGTDKLKNATAESGTCDTATRAILSSVVELGKQLRKRAPGAPGLSEEEVHKQLEDQLEETLKGVSLHDCINPLLGMPGVDVHMDTPTELLHTVLPGVVKYFWAQTVFLVEKANKLGTLQTRLASVDPDGLNAPSLNAEYICRYKGGLIGKHFKSLAQVMPFVIYDLVLTIVLDGWIAIGELVVLCWHTVIEDREVYLAELSKAIENLLNITAQCSPSILITKPKFHFLVHLPAYIRRFGPAILFSTERYKSFNHVFRQSSIYSNRQAPSRDSCKAFAGHDMVKHVALGGFWYDRDAKRWVRAGSAILDYMEAHPEQKRFFGWTCPDGEEAGANICNSSTGTATFPPQTAASVPMAVPHGEPNGQIDATNSRDPPKPSSIALLGRQTIAIPILLQEHPNSAPIRPSGASKYYQAATCKIGQGELVKVGAHVLAKRADGPAVVGRVLEMLVPHDADVTVAHVALQVLDFLPTRHPQLHLPRLSLTDTRIVVAPSEIQCIVNLQHDCASSECSELHHTRIIQERLPTTRLRPRVTHKGTGLFVLNTLSIHNYAQIAAALSETLRASSLLVADADTICRNAVAVMAQKKATNGTKKMTNT
ncbi:hypothetical protein BV20DRAFT_1038073 [Pilatotrama ljubarskyi]|nr:hypothetical protein BV20DRAFT_1038073 [Pilatotrama ljubarskyi]